MQNSRPLPSKSQSLLDLLNAALDHYLTHPGFLQGEEGRQRARRYKAALTNFQGKEMTNELIRKVYEDIVANKGEGSLGTSSSLRKDLQKALCQFLGVSQDSLTLTKAILIRFGISELQQQAVVIKEQQALAIAMGSSGGGMNISGKIAEMALERYAKTVMAQKVSSAKEMQNVVAAGPKINS